MEGLATLIDLYALYFKSVRNYNCRLRKRKLLLMYYPPPMGLPGGSGYNTENGQRWAACGPHDGKRRHA